MTDELDELSRQREVREKREGGEWLKRAVDNSDGRGHVTGKEYPVADVDLTTDEAQIPDGWLYEQPQREIDDPDAVVIVTEKSDYARRPEAHQRNWLFNRFVRFAVLRARDRDARRKR